MKISKKQPTISVIIPTKNRPEVLSRVLAAVFKQYPRVYEVIVVDTSDTIFQPETKKSADSYPNRNIRYWRLPQSSASRARNVGIEKSTGSILAFLDDDSVPEPGWVRAIYNAVTVGPYWFRGLCIDTSKDITVVHDFYTFYKELTTRDLKRQWIQNGFLNGYQLVDRLQAGNFFVTRKVLMKMHPVFDEKLFPFIAEEMDLSQRIGNSGGKILFVPKAKIRHYFIRLGYVSLIVYSAFWYGRALKILNDRTNRFLKTLRQFGQIASTKLQKRKADHRWDLIREGYSLFHTKYSQDPLYDCMFIFLCINFLLFLGIGSFYGVIENIWYRKQLFFKKN